MLATKRALVSFAGLALAACASMGPQDTDQYIFLDESETLYVKFRNSTNLVYEMDMPDIAESMKKLRRDDFMQVMQELLYLYALPIEVHILEEWEEPGPGPVLDIVALRFEQERSGDLIATISAKLKWYDELNTLGTYSERSVSPASISRQQMDKAFRDVIRKPLQEMMDDLFQHFRSPEEIKRVNAPLEELEER